MKYCQYCGHELLDEAVMCPNCKKMVENVELGPKKRNLAKAIKILFIIEIIGNFLSGLSNILTGIESLIDYNNGLIQYNSSISDFIVGGYSILSLAWLIPLAFIINKKLAKKQPIHMAMKIIVLIFGAFITGVLLLIHNDVEVNKPEGVDSGVL